MGLVVAGMGGAFRPEEDIVVSCLRSRGDPDSRLDCSVDGSLDWGVVAETAMRHGVGPLVLDTLPDQSSNVEQDTALSALRERSQRLAQRNLQMLREVATLSRRFREAGIRAVPYKGPIVAEVAYGNAASREFGDLDFLVDRDAVRKARSILMEQGYEPQFEVDSTESLSDGQEWAYVRFTRDYEFHHGSKGVTVELHWRIVAQHFPTSICLKDVWERLTSLSVGGMEIPTLSPADRIVVLCVHGTRHRWEQLRWICDIAESIRNTDVDWEVVAELSARHNCERMVYLGLSLANDLLNAPLPDEVRAKIESDSKIESLREHVIDRLFDRTDYTQFHLRYYQAKTQERYRDKCRLWLSWLFKPERSAIEAVPLPRPLFPLYVAIHWGQLTRGGIERLIR